LSLDNLIYSDVLDASENQLTSTTNKAFIVRVIHLILAQFRLEGALCIMNVYCYLKAIQLANSELEFVEQFIELIEEIMQEHIESLNYDDFHPSITMSMIPE